MFKILSTCICWKKMYMKCNIWRAAVRPSYIWDARLLKVNIKKLYVLPSQCMDAFCMDPR